jgi:hypothetical protein
MSTNAAVFIAPCDRSALPNPHPALGATFSRGEKG